ncbi:MAG TPA: ATP-binding protein [Gemmatimonadaceae bacterium]|nr:ATP-binding protein [Gemmatimonadaceae bacterium]
MLSTSVPLILVVDDTAANRFVVGNVLKKSGFRVIEAASGREALSGFDQDPDLVVLDVRLPDATGFELARRLRGLPDHKSTPILFISASFTEPGAHAQGLESGADAYLNHPIDATLLVATVRSLLRTRRAEDVERFLADASEVFAGSLDPNEAARALATASVPHVADGCVVLQPAEPGVRPEPIIRALPGLQAGLERVFKDFPPDGHAHDPITASLRQTTVESYVPKGKRGAALTAIGINHAVTLPLIARARPLGSATFYSTGEPFDDAAIRVLTNVSHRASLAIDNARLFHEADAARHEAQVANAAKVDFLAAMSHELRTPLNAIAGFVDLMALGIHGPITPDQRGDLARISQNQRHLATLIEDILNYARLEAGRLEYDMQKVLVGDALAEVHTLARPVFDAKGVRFEYAPGDGGAIASADPDRLRQVLLNVVGNAVKFTPTGGSVVLTSAADSQSVRLLCKDTGRGIPTEKLATIFEPFVQVDRHLNSSANQGIGLGLSISRDLMRGMDGDLMVESEMGAGSTFTMVLRRARTARDNARDTTGAAVERRPGGTTVSQNIG